MVGTKLAKLKFRIKTMIDVKGEYVKIIEKKEAFADWIKEVECNGLNWNQNGKVACESKLEIDKNDIYKRKWFKYPDYEGFNYGFMCPNCGCFTELEDKDLPNGLKILAKEWTKYQ